MTAGWATACMSAPAPIWAGMCVWAAGSWLGIGCSVIQGVRIGEYATVGAGAAVIRDVTDGLTVAGVPAREIASRRDAT